ncbi:Hypothetical predicted protein [Cloeon dipterum]|uniref:Uncharacterized protein n=1 Tax=Cloeon dipterum TaxID=197152 RepID=A0A8S1C989_9INSE|nr:Hypothetical predicted protein [Cloeon dipterum]
MNSSRPCGWSSDGDDDSSSIPYADADSGDLRVRWDTSEESSADEEAAAACSGVDSCSLNNLLDALAEAEGGVAAAHSFSTLLDSDLDVPDAPSVAAARARARGHTLPKQRVKWDDEPDAGVQLTPDELYYYCPRKASHNNNGSLLKKQQLAAADRRKKSATLDNAAAHVDRSYLSRQKGNKF